MLCAPCRTFAESVAAVHVALLALQEALAKQNAAIRAHFPQSHPLVRAMERNCSGWANNAPYVLQRFMQVAEGAPHTEFEQDCCLNRGVGEVLGAARKWAGRPPLDNRGREVWKKRISIIELGLFQLVRARSNAFFGLVWRLQLPGGCVGELVPA